MAHIKQYVDLPLEEVIGDRFGRYSKYIIQDRALPDVRDGLKPVQRRILYAMHQDKNTHDKNFRKAAKTVGAVIGSYHPHGDSSVYEAMVRLSQDWKMRNELIEMHGNNGSIDGDPPAAMRYTEARLSSVTSELLKDIDKNTVDYIPNFDDTMSEPVVFPAKFPNLLVNGSTGISAGYATEIPSHNLEEVIDAVIMRIDNPNVSVDRLMTVLKGPDFPTGGIIQGIEGIKSAYNTGKGRIIVRGKAAIKKTKGNREQIIIEEIPYDVNKASMVRKVDELINDRKVEGITEIRDETDRTGLRIVIDLRKDADSNGLLNYLYKNTDLQVTYNFNMVAIQNKTPKLLSLPEILDAYIDHQKNVITRQTKFDLERAIDRAHIVDGLIKAVSILDELITTIRASKNKQDAKMQIEKKYGFTEKQAEAIVMLQLYRLTNTDITLLEKEAHELKEKIDTYNSILSSDKKLFQLLKKNLRQIKKTYATNRRTLIEDEIENLSINIEVTIPSEDVLVTITKDGYVKRTSIRSYAASNRDDFTIKENDYLISLLEINTTDKLLLFTNKGKFICIPVHELPDIRWKDIGQHISNIAPLDEHEHIIEGIPVRKFTDDHFLLFITKKGMVKRSKLNLYDAQRFSRALIAVNLKDEDEVVNVYQTDGHSDIFITSNKGYGLWFHESDISIVGQRAQGVIGIQLKNEEFVVNGHAFDGLSDPSIVVITQRGACKRMKLNEFEKSTRAKRGLIMLRELKKKAHRIEGFFFIHENDNLCFRTSSGESHRIYPLELPFSDRYSNGSFVIDSDNQGEVEQTWLEAEYKKPFSEDNN
ncbi:DNA topoisomerase IV subunit A [Virgibacillus sp. W0181]|uniref:DNA topoisomerase IV subunit A n=1 Tax=Virgibacillus sp. W0181 TaxID=3391581 RepID=UPI003F44F360